MQLSKSFNSPDIGNQPDGPVKQCFERLFTSLEDQHRKLYNDINTNFIHGLKSGATLVSARETAYEIWKTSGHATLPDNVLMIGV